MGGGGSATAGLRTYREVLGHGPAARPFAASVLARLPISMAPLAIVLLVSGRRGSYGLAGVVTGALALGAAVGAPVWGRAMDRVGQPPVAAGTAVASAAMLAALAVGTVTGLPAGALVGLAGLAGLAWPPMSAAMRAAWRVTLPDARRRRAGYALDAVSVESIFVGGPLLLSLLLVIAPPVVPLLVTAAVLAVGGVTYSGTRAARRAPSVRTPAEPVAAQPDPARPAPDPGAATGPAVRRTGTFRAPGLPAVFVVTAAMAVGFGQIDTSLAATAREVLGDPGRLGYLFAAIAGGSTLGGLAYGALRGAAGEHRRLPLTLGVFAAGLVPLAVLLSAGRPPLLALEPFLFLSGLAIAPSLIIGQNLVDALAPAGRVTEAQAWLSTATTTGSAAGTALAGVLVDSGGVGRALTGAVAAVAVAGATALGAQRTWRRAAPTPPDAVEPLLTPLR